MATDWPAVALTTAAVPRAVSLRIRHVDSLRAVAAGLVVWAHLVQTFATIAHPDPAFLRFLDTWPDVFNAGRVGVTIFFAVSGFVICRSFGGPRAGGARRFLIRRFCRLYPAFWVSMLAGIPILWLTGKNLSWAMLWANVTMAPAAFGQPPILGVYWTLEIELIFYGLCLGLYLLHGIDRPWCWQRWSGFLRLCRGSSG
jgi:peptidoglycan/LPS O-acetylase OafA/YrhL